ncbi:putative enzyme related to lactoylglutathione lyase [Xanthomonas translucens]
MPSCRLFAIVVLGMALAPAGLHAQAKGHVTGVGGIFVKSEHPKALMTWYRDVLGIRIEPWGGAALSYDAPGHPPVLALNAFARDSDYMAPSKREFMLNFAVDDLDAILKKVEASGVAVLKRDDDDPSGRFAWIVDPDGTKIELWQPKADASP